VSASPSVSGQSQEAACPFSYAGPEELRDRVVSALTAVVDPELALTIVDLGLVYGVEINNGAIRVRMTMTSVACPVTDVIVDEVQFVVPPSGADHCSRAPRDDASDSTARTGAAESARGRGRARPWRGPVEQVRRRWRFVWRRLVCSGWLVWRFRHRSPNPFCDGHGALYVPLVALHASLLLRFLGGIGRPELRTLGAELNAIALALFAITLAGSAIAFQRRRGTTN
jgi:hypothetical protein